MQEQLTDQERLELAKLEYQFLELGQPIQVGRHRLGTVLEHYYEEADGFQLYVIGHASHPRELILLFKGSAGLRHGNPTTWNNEWLATNLPLLVALLFRQRRIPDQLTTAARVLNDLLRRYPISKFYIYGHSLGAINAQYAMANCNHLGRIKHAWLYEGTNMYSLLTPRQRRRAKKFRARIENYIDIHDPVTLGYINAHYLIGQLRYVDSERMDPVHQHMWGGYRFNEQGQLLLRPLDDTFWESTQREQALIELIATGPSKLPTGWQSRPQFLETVEEKLRELAEHIPRF